MNKQQKDGIYPLECFSEPFPEWAGDRSFTVTIASQLDGGSQFSPGSPAETDASKYRTK